MQKKEKYFSIFYRHRYKLQLYPKLYNGHRHSLKVWQWQFFPLLLQMLRLGGSMSHLCSSTSSFSIAYSSPFCVKPQLNTTLVVYSLPQSIRQTRTHAQSCCVGNILRLGWCTFFSQFKYMYIPNLELVYTLYPVLVAVFINGPYLS